MSDLTFTAKIGPRRSWHLTWTGEGDPLPHARTFVRWSGARPCGTPWTLPATCASERRKGSCDLPPQLWHCERAFRGKFKI